MSHRQHRHDQHAPRPPAPTITVNSELNLPPAVIEEYKQNNKSSGERENRQTLIGAITVVALVIALVIQACQLKLTRITSERSERAWITTTGVGDFTDPAEEGKVPKALFHLENTGHTPATDIHVGAVLIFINGHPDIAALNKRLDDYMNAGTKSEGTYIGPGAKYDIPLILSRQWLNPVDTEGKAHPGMVLSLPAYLVKEDALAINTTLSD